jgi:hypothetical protein
VCLGCAFDDGCFQINLTIWEELQLEKQWFYTTVPRAIPNKHRTSAWQIAVRMFGFASLEIPALEQVRCHLS